MSTGKCSRQVQAVTWPDWSFPSCLISSPIGCFPPMVLHSCANLALEHPAGLFGTIRQHSHQNCGQQKVVMQLKKKKKKSQSDIHKGRIYQCNNIQSVEDEFLTFLRNSSATIRALALTDSFISLISLSISSMKWMTKSTSLCLYICSVWKLVIKKLISYP